MNFALYNPEHFQGFNAHRQYTLHVRTTAQFSRCKKVHNQRYEEKMGVLKS
jgi:hypothetical protein